MAVRYEKFQAGTRGAVLDWISHFPEMQRYALFDVQRLNEEQITALDANRWGITINLYGDIKGAAIAAQGPRLVQIPPELLPEVIELAQTTRSVSLLLGQCDFSTLSVHLQAIREVEIPNQTAALFRYQDMHVSAALFPILLPAESNQCLGPLSAWSTWDACNGLHVISDMGQRNMTTALRFSAKTVEMLDERLFVHAARAQVNDIDSSLLAGYSECEAETVIRQRIEMAKSLGLDFQDDQALYCALSLQFPDGFEKEAPFAEAIKYRDIGKPSFGVALDEVPTSAWKLWDERIKEKEIQ